MVCICVWCVCACHACLGTAASSAIGWARDPVESRSAAQDSGASPALGRPAQGFLMNQVSEASETTTKTRTREWAQATSMCH